MRADTVMGRVGVGIDGGYVDAAGDLQRWPSFSPTKALIWIRLTTTGRTPIMIADLLPIDKAVDLMTKLILLERGRSEAGAKQPPRR